MTKVIISMFLGFSANMIYEANNPIESFGIWLVGWVSSYAIILITTQLLKKR